MYERGLSMAAHSGGIQQRWCLPELGNLLLKIAPDREMT
jgi:hypothetical protein